MIYRWYIGRLEEGAREISLNKVKPDAPPLEQLLRGDKLSYWQKTCNNEHWTLQWFDEKVIRKKLGRVHENEVFIQETDLDTNNPAELWALPDFKLIPYTAQASKMAAKIYGRLEGDEDEDEDEEE